MHGRCVPVCSSAFLHRGCAVHAPTVYNSTGHLQCMLGSMCDASWCNDEELSKFAIAVATDAILEGANVRVYARTVEHELLGCQQLGQPVPGGTCNRCS